MDTSQVYTKISANAVLKNRDVCREVFSFLPTEDTVRIASADDVPSVWRQVSLKKAKEDIHLLELDDMHAILGFACNTPSQKVRTCANRRIQDLVPDCRVWDYLTLRQISSYEGKYPLHEQTYHVVEDKIQRIDGLKPGRSYAQMPWDGISSSSETDKSQDRLLDLDTENTRLRLEIKQAKQDIHALHQIIEGLQNTSLSSPQHNKQTKLRRLQHENMQLKAEIAEVKEKISFVENLLSK